MQVREKLGIAAELRAAPTPTIHKRTRARRKQLIDHLESVDEVTTSDVANLLGIGRTNASQFLSTMLRDGKIRQVGYGRYALPYSRVKITQPDPPQEVKSPDFTDTLLKRAKEYVWQHPEHAIAIRDFVVTQEVLGKDV